MFLCSQKYIFSHQRLVVDEKEHIIIQEFGYTTQKNRDISKDTGVIGNMNI